MSRLESLAYTAMRVVLGGLFAIHGVQKVFGVLVPHAPAVGSQLWIGGVIELVTGVLIAAGLFTRIAAFVACGEMAVAYVQFHWKLAFDAHVLPQINGGELAVLYCFAFLAIFARGAGPYSLDGRDLRPAGGAAEGRRGSTDVRLGRA